MANHIGYMAVCQRPSPGRVTNCYLLVKLCKMERVMRIPSYGTVTYGQLKLSPYWDPLRGDPRFQKIVASAAPK